MMKGFVHSLQSLGTVDGPGVRFVVFFQGCPLRCKCCHNPDTWNMSEGTQYSSEEIVNKVLRYKEYFRNGGGITISGGEPLMQPEFAAEIFSLCKEQGINTCLDTSGCVMNDKIKKLLTVTNRVLLDMKYKNEELYIENVGCSKKAVDEFLSYLNAEKIPVTLRQVIIPEVNDDEDNISFIRSTMEKFSVIDKIELLPFRKICETKYKNLGLKYPFGDKNEPDSELMKKLNSLL